jgi:tripartite-type tricarboxylate transporter receptor subunit TctC
MTVSGLVKAAGVALLVGLATLPAGAQDAERAYFAGKTVRFVVGFGAGGGYDSYARMLAPYLAKQLDATVIVENQPGAGGLVALNRIYTAPPDGLTLMIANGTGAAFSQLTGQQGARYDLGKFGYLATVSAPPSMWLVGPASPIKTIKEALSSKRKWRWAASGPADSLSDGAAFTCEAFKLDCHIVLGYRGSNDAALAVARGEMDALYVTDTSANNYARANKSFALATMGGTRSRFFPDLPTIFEAVQMNADQKWLFEFRNTLHNLGRILVVPPGMPAARIGYMQAAVRRALQDRQFLAEGDKRQLYTDYVDAAGTRKNAMTIVVDSTPEQRKRVQNILAKAR